MKILTTYLTQKLNFVIKFNSIRMKFKVLKKKEQKINKIKNVIFKILEINLI